jgi:hypothetical protein
MLCPNCKLENPSSALRCDCGYEFSQGGKPLPRRVGASKATPSGGSGLTTVFWVLTILGFACRWVPTPGVLHNREWRTPTSGRGSDGCFPSSHPVLPSAGCRRTHQFAPWLTGDGQL